MIDVAANAEGFVMEMARLLRSRGRDVQIHRDRSEVGGESFEYLSATSPAPSWFDASIIVAARKYRGRWAFCDVRIRTGSGRQIKATTYGSARIAVEVYGRK